MGRWELIICGSRVTPAEEMPPKSGGRLSGRGPYKWLGKTIVWQMPPMIANLNVIRCIIFHSLQGDGKCYSRLAWKFMLQSKQTVITSLAMALQQLTSAEDLPLCVLKHLLSSNILRADVKGGGTLASFCWLITPKREITTKLMKVQSLVQYF